MASVTVQQKSAGNSFNECAKENKKHRYIWLFVWLYIKWRIAAIWLSFPLDGPPLGRPTHGSSEQRAKFLWNQNSDRLIIFAPMRTIPDAKSDAHSVRTLCGKLMSVQCNNPHADIFLIDLNDTWYLIFWHVGKANWFYCASRLYSGLQFWQCVPS